MGGNVATINTIQAMRGIAATLVVVFHTYVHLAARNIIPDVPLLVDMGKGGVDMFFVISGFIMVYITDGQDRSPAVINNFLVRRCIRVIPIYWFYTLLMAAMLLLLPQLVSQGKAFDYEHFIASMLFIPWDNNLGEPKPTLQVGWTLNFEMYFYLLFAVMLLLAGRFYLVMMAVIMAMGVMAGLLFRDLPAQLYVITSPLLLEFLMGSVACVLYKRFNNIGVLLPVMLVLAGVSVMIYTGFVELDGYHRVVKWGIPSFMILTGLIYLERSVTINVPKILMILGASSYSLYLSHVFTINAVGKVWGSVVSGYYELFILVAIAVSMLVGYLSYIIIEKPVTSKLNRLYGSRK